METQALVSGTPTSRKKFFFAFLVLVAFPALWIVYVQNGDIAQITIIDTVTSVSGKCTRGKAISGNFKNQPFL